MPLEGSIGSATRLLKLRAAFGLILCIIQVNALWVEIPKVEVPFHVVYNTGTVRLQSLPQGALACGVGPGFIYFRTTGECPTYKDISLPRGAMTQFRDAGEHHCVESEITLIDHRVLGQFTADERDTASKALARGCTCSVSHTVQSGGVDSAETVNTVTGLKRYVLQRGTQVKFNDGTIACGVVSGTCSYGSFRTTLIGDTVYTACGQGVTGYVVGGAGDQSTLKWIEADDSELGRYMPSGSSVNIGEPIGITIQDYFRSAIPTEMGTSNRKRRSAIAYASGVLAYTIVVERATSKAFGVGDSNFKKIQNGVNKLSEYSAELANSLANVIRANENQYFEQSQLEVKNQYLNDVIDELSNKVRNLEKFSLKTVEYFQRGLIDEIQESERIKKQVEANNAPGFAAEFHVTQEAYLIRIQFGDSFLNEESEEHQCGDTLCFGLGDFFHYRNYQDVVIVSDPIITSTSCGVFFRDSLVKETVSALSTIAGVVNYLKSKNVEFTAINMVECPADNIEIAATSFGELQRRLNALDEGRVLPVSDEQFIVECSMNSTLARDFPTLCNTKMQYGDLTLPLDKISPFTIELETMKDQFDKSTQGLRLLEEMATATGEGLGQTLKAAAKLPMAVYDSLTDGLLDRVTGMAYASLAVSVICLIFTILFTFLVLRKRAMSGAGSD